jgi:hypothetical protein
MSISITGGISFSGGVGITAAPPSTATAGWWGAGQNTTSVQRVTFATDTATATLRGPLNASSYFYGLAAAGTLSDGWYGGGTQSGVGDISTVNRITYATDTATASIKGPLSLARAYLGATSDGTTYGWFGGGQTGAPVRSAVDRITYATDTATASVRGPLSGNRSRVTGTGTSTDGWFGGGYGGSPLSTVNRITYATDTATASVKGSLNIPTGFMAASTDGTTYGWFAGGFGPYSAVQRITYANDTATASLRGPLTSTIYGVSAAGDSTYGWFGGGRNPATPEGIVTTVQRITYATDTATASIRGPLSTPTTLSGAAAGAQ